ncbi:MAG: enoyl-CoA hydratase/isomerase family protein [Gammaproteobacteria bacterium]|jgi:enoyl-CoA hydratase/carnithine racemase|nr:enoyl-CoA hydratase [Chromatiales bacterium]MDP6675570.1 enoyl-CoA hydratase/isomerase family protein [Gammaproteobacteria bacterium]
MLEIISHGDITELRMNRTPANALNHDLLEAILAGYAEALDAGARGLILSGQPGMFCAGIDVPELLGQSRSEIQRFWSLLFRTGHTLAACPVPVVAALAGHSPAGGAVLAAHCDYRIAADGTFKIGFNEVQVGLPLPASILYLFKDLVGTRLARLGGMQGQLMLMASALEIGLVDELVPPDVLEERTLEFLRDLLALPTVAMNTTRMSGKQELLKVLSTSDDVDKTTAAWFTDETQSAMKRLVESLNKSK